MTVYYNTGEYLNFSPPIITLGEMRSMVFSKWREVGVGAAVGITLARSKEPARTAGLLVAAGLMGYGLKNLVEPSLPLIERIIERVFDANGPSVS